MVQAAKNHRALLEAQQAEQFDDEMDYMEEAPTRGHVFAQLDEMSLGSSAGSSTVGETLMPVQESSDFRLPWLETILVDHRIVKNETN